MISSTIDEKWNDCNFVGNIKKYDMPKKDEAKRVEILDDYDMRNGHGGRFHVFKSRFDRMEC